MGSTWDRIVTSAPLDTTAAKATSPSADNYDPVIGFGCAHWDAPPPCVPIPRGPDFVDLTGRKFGEFTVIGFLGQNAPKYHSTWLVRCSCGDYELRRRKAVINPANREDRCTRCRDWQYKKRRYAELGAKPLAAFVKKEPVS